MLPTSNANKKAYLSTNIYKTLISVLENYASEPDKYFPKMSREMPALYLDYGVIVDRKMKNDCFIVTKQLFTHLIILQEHVCNSGPSLHHRH